MKYKILLSEDGTYVKIRVFEAITGEMEREFAEKAIKEAKQLSIKNFLVDVRGIPNVAATFEQFLFAYKDMDQFALDKSSRIAILADIGDKSHELIETAFQNAGYHCRLFTNKESALKWLRE
jgi:hypothetical protein